MPGNFLRHGTTTCFFFSVGTPVSGWGFGPKTRARVVEFQTNHGLATDLDLATANAYAVTHGCDDGIVRGIITLGFESQAISFRAFGTQNRNITTCV